MQHMTMTWEQVKPFLDWIVFAGSVFAAVYTILFKWKKTVQKIVGIKETMLGIKPLKSEISSMSSRMESMGLVMQSMDETLVMIKNQLFPNGGKSLDDKLNVLINQQQTLASRQRALAYENPTPSFEMDSKGRLIWVNRSFCMLVGKLPVELEGFGWVNILVPEIREQSAEMWQTAVNEQRDFDEHFTIMNSSGQKTDASFKAMRILNSTNQITGYFGTLAIQ